MMSFTMITLRPADILTEYVNTTYIMNLFVSNLNSGLTSVHPNSFYLDLTIINKGIRNVLCNRPTA